MDLVQCKNLNMELTKCMILVTIRATMKGIEFRSNDIYILAGKPGFRWANDKRKHYQSHFNTLY